MNSPANISSLISTDTNVAVWNATPALPSAPAKTLKVLHVINGEHFSGAERVQQLLGRCLPEFGVDPHFACVKPGKFPAMCGLPDEKVHLFPMRGRVDWKSMRQLSDFVRSEQFDLLHAHTPRSAMVTGFVAKTCGLPWVYHVHSPTARDSTRAILNRVNDIVERWSLRNCSKIVTVSRSLRREMLHQGWDRTKLVAIGNGVACQEPIVPEDRKTRNSWTLGMVALFRPRKGIEVLLEALSLLPDELDSIELRVIGGFETEAYEQQVRQLIASLGLKSRVHLTGFTTDVSQEMRQLDGMVLPSLFGEGMPMVVLEAMAVGVPILATRVEGTPEVVRDGVEGYLAAPRDPVSLASAIERFTQSRDRWTEMSHNAFQRHREHFTDRRMAEKLARVYRSMLR